MSRFGNLEFDDQNEKKLPPAPAGRDENYFLRMADESFRKGNFAVALADYGRVLVFKPDSVDAWAGQVRMYLELGNFAEGLRWADQALAKFPEEPELLATKASLLARLGDLKAAMTFSDASMDEGKESCYVWLSRGDVLLALKEKRAEYCFQKAMHLQVDDWLIPWLCSRIYSFYQSFALGLKMAKQALVLAPEQSCIWLQSARCELGLGFATNARYSLQQASALGGENQECRDLTRETQALGIFSRCRGYLKKIFNRT